MKKNRIVLENLFFVFCCIATAMIFSCYRVYNGDFIAYNGDFQNYNIFRRILAGQTQFVDFVNYLGVGGVIINLPFLMIRNTFGFSVFVTNFTSSIIFSLIIFIASYLYTGCRLKSFKITEVINILCFILLHANLKGYFYQYYVECIAHIEELGHSLRTVRGFLPYFVVALYLFANRISNNRINLGKLLHEKKYILVSSIIVGLLFPWSNDFGIGSVGCLGIILVMFQLFEKRASFATVLGRLGIYIFGVFWGGISSIAIITHGKITNYIKINAGIADYQYWYYQKTVDKYATVWDIFADKKFLVFTLIFIIYGLFIIYKMIKKDIKDNELCILYLQSVNFAAALIYVIGSGHHNYYLFQLICYFAMCDFAKKGFAYLKKNMHISKNNNLLKKKKYINASIIYGLLLCVMYLCSISIIFRDHENEEREYIKGLDAYSTIGNGLDEVANELSGQTVFSTYASAIETINDVYQPTGTDYIIHVLGDEQRENYVNDFLCNNYDYVTTLNSDYTTWEYWVIRSNWFFYRHLYMQYEPCQKTNYSVIWERSSNKNVIETDANLFIEKVDDATSKVTIDLPDCFEDVYVDLEISYSTEWTKGRIAQMAYRKSACVRDGGEPFLTSCYYLPQNAEEYYIPVHAVDGHGEIYISSYPFSCTKLQNLKIEVKNIIEFPDFGLNLVGYNEGVQGYAEDTISDDNKVLKFMMTESNYAKLRDGDALISNNQKAEIENINVEGMYIYVQLRDSVNPEKFNYPNEITVIDDSIQSINMTDNDWICGIHRRENCIIVRDNIEIEKLKYVQIGNIKKKVSKIEKVTEGTIIYFEDERDIRQFAYPNRFKLIY